MTGKVYVAKESTSQEIKETTQAILAKLNNSNEKEMFVINAILSDDEALNEWGFRQDGIGSVINNAFDLNSAALAACGTVAEIAANKSVMAVIGANAAAVRVCVRNKVLVAAMEDEHVLAAGMGYAVFDVGDVVTLNYGGTPTEFRVVHKNYRTQNKIVLVSENVLAETRWIYVNKSEAYKSCNLRTYLNSTVLSNFSEEIQAAMAASAFHPSQYDGVLLNDKIWALSYNEVMSVTSTNDHADNSALDYFKDAESRKKTLNGTAYGWWLRTKSGDTSAYYIDTAGNVSSSSSGTYGVVPAFEI